MVMEQADVPFNRARWIDFRQQIQLSFCAHKKNRGERKRERGAEQPFLSNGGLTLVQRRVSFGEKWHEKGSEREHSQRERERGMGRNQ